MKSLTVQTKNNCIVLRYVDPETNAIQEDLVSFLECDSDLTVDKHWQTRCWVLHLRCVVRPTMEPATCLER